MRVPFSPKLGGEDGRSAGNTENRQVQQEEHLAGQADGCDRRLTLLADHDRSDHVQCSGCQPLQDDGRGQFGELAEIGAVVTETRILTRFRL